MRKLLLFLALLCPFAAFAGDVYNPGASSIGDYPDVDNPRSSRAALACSYAPVTTGTQGTVYNGATPSATGGTPPYAFSDTGTALPAALTINTSTGVISGTPSGSGSTAGIQVSVTDAASNSVPCGAAFTLVISPSGATCTFQSFATEAAGTATATFTSVNIGTAASNRVVAVIPMGRTTTGGLANPVTGVSFTVGATATLSQVSGAAATTGSVAAASDIWSAAVPSGTTATITVNWTNVNSRSGIYVYTINTSTPTPANGAESTGTSATSLTQSITVPSNGCGIVGTFTLQTGATASFTNATLDSSNAMSGAANATAAAHTTSTGSVSVTGTMAGGANNMVMSLASWGP